MRVLLTGASGFLGSFIAEQLVARGHAVGCLVRSDSDVWRLAAVRDSITLLAGDLAERESVWLAIERVQPDAIIHAAWRGVANSDRNDPAQAENVVAAAGLAELSADAGVATFVGLGSQAEYGPLNRITREDDPLRPTTLYGIMKVAAADFAERICERAGIRFAWLRVFSTYGPRDNEFWLVPSLVLKLLRGEYPSLTAGAQMWDFLHARDLACAVLSVLESSTAAGRFNVGSGQAPPLRRTIETLRDMINPAAKLGFGEIPYRSDQVMHLEADISRLHAATGWSPSISLEEGLRETVDWFRLGR